MRYAIKTKGNDTRIYINDILHLRITDRITSIQSWKNEHSWYVIEIKTKDNSTILEYDSKDKWIEILKLLDNIDS